MKKRQNYFQVHKNKNKKALNKKRKFRNLLFLRLSVHQANVAMQTSMISSQPNLVGVEKKKALIQLLTNSAETIPKIFKQEMQRRFLLTKRYVKNGK